MPLHGGCTSDLSTMVFHCPPGRRRNSESTNICENVDATMVAVRPTGEEAVPESDLVRAFSYLDDVR